MPFTTEPSSLKHIRRGPDFDQNEDLVRVDLSEQHFFVSHIDNVWWIREDDPSMSPSMAQRLEELQTKLSGTIGLRVDSANIGQVALFSSPTWGWKDIYRSELPVSDLSFVRRADIDISNVVLLENHTSDQS